MHFKNGRQAIEGDKVISKDGQGRTQIGIIIDLYPGSDTCNATLQRPIGQSWSVNIKDCYHAEDALAAIEAANKPAEAAPAESSAAQKTE